MVRERDYAIDIVKFLAVLLIINSHADTMYPHLKVLATGGAIGDCLFLFCSGFTLFIGRKRMFGNYYKQRINRIYPSVFVAALFCCIIRQETEVKLMGFLGGEFIVAIMTYYVFLYFIQRYMLNKVNWIFGLGA